MRRLQHNHIVKFVDFFKESNDDVYLVMEFCTGGELYDVFTSMKYVPTVWSENTIKKIAYEIMLAIDYCHSKGIAHRDLKPQNIMVKEKWSIMSDFPSIKIVDFGGAAVFKDNRTFIGSPSYMAPELFDKPPYDYRKADNWSIGIILYEILFGKKPLQASTVPELLQQYIKIIKINKDEHLPVLAQKDGCSDECMQILKSLLAINPEQRKDLKYVMSSKWFSSVSEQVRPEYVLEHLKQYTLVDKFKRNCYHSLVHDLPPEQKLQTVKLFYKIAGPDKILSIREMYLFIYGIQTGLGVEIEEIQLNNIDLNDNHMIDMDEFCVAMLASLFTSTFRLTDFYNNYSNLLSAENVISFFGDNRDKGTKVFMKIDTDGSGIISQKEFIQWLLLNIKFEIE